MKYRWYEVTYEGIKFTVQGDWEDAIKGDLSEPKQQAGFYEYDITMEDVSIHELLLPNTIYHYYTRIERLHLSMEQPNALQLDHHLIGIFVPHES